MNSFFKVLHKSKKSKARLGEIKTDHGVIKTPAFIPAATKGTIKSLSPQLIKEIGIQAGCVNTYHLVTHPGADIIEKAGGIHKYSQLNIPLMSDSGGFQVFSLARKDKSQISNLKYQINLKSKNLNSKQNNDSGQARMTSFWGVPLSGTTPESFQKKVDIRGEEQPLVVKISEDGVKFRSTFDGQLIEFTPEKSMEYQQQIGADINMAFDECTYYPATHEYAEKAMERTHEWLLRCIKYKDSESKFLSHTSQKRKNFSSSSFKKQYLYGVIQGSTFEDLRKKSAEFVVSQNTPGVAIGGVSVGESKKEMREQVKWVADYLPKDRPVHLLGVGQIDDIIDLVKYGIDTFDCVEPTRLARMGRIYCWQQILSEIHSRQGSPPKRSSPRCREPFFSATCCQFNYDILKQSYKNNLEKVDIDCDCYVCKNFTKSYLHHLFKQREILGYTLATFHNLWVMEKLFDKIREAIKNNFI